MFGDPSRPGLLHLPPPRLIKALRRPPGPFGDGVPIAPGLRSGARWKTRVVPPHKQRIPVRVSHTAAEHSKSLLLDDEIRVERSKGLPPVARG